MFATVETEKKSHLSMRSVLRTKLNVADICTEDVPHSIRYVEQTIFKECFEGEDISRDCRRTRYDRCV